MRTVEGVRFLLGHPLLRRLVLTGAVLMLISGVNGALVYAVMDDGLHRPPEFVGVLSAVQGAGTVLSGLLAGPLLRRTGKCRLATSGGLLAMAAVALRAVPSDAVVLAASLPAGLGLPWVLMAAATAVQRISAPDRIAATAATANTLLFAPSAAEMAVAAGLVALADHRVVLVCAAAVGCLAVLLGVTGRTDPVPAGAGRSS